MRTGLYFGISIPVLIATLLIRTHPDTGRLMSVLDHKNVANAATLLQIYGGFSVPILFICLFGLNMYVWKSESINYRFIFEFDPRDNLDYHQFFEV
jgi:hypothetical protein